MLPDFKTYNATFEERKILVNNFMHRVSLGLENYKQRLGDLGIDAKTIIANLTKLDKNDVGIEEKIDKLLEEVKREQYLSEKLMDHHQLTGKTLEEQYNSLKVDTLTVFELLTNIGMMNGTMINLFESLEFSQDKWFQELNKTSQRVILNQASIMDLHKNTIEKLEHVDTDLDSITDEIKRVAVIAEYSNSFHNLRDIQNRFNRVEKTEGYKLLESTVSLDDFIDFALQAHAHGSESSIDRIFRMIFGRNALNDWHIFKIFPKLCQRPVFESIKNLLTNSIKLLNLAWLYERDTSIPYELTQRWGRNLVKFDELFVDYCGCQPGLRKFKGGKLSTLLSNLMESEKTLADNLWQVTTMESLDAHTAKKLMTVLRVFNFELSSKAIRFIETFAFEEIETLSSMPNSPLH